MEKIEEVFSKPWSERTKVLYYLRCACFFELVSKKNYQVLDQNWDSESSSGENVELEGVEQTLLDFEEVNVELNDSRV